MNINIKLLPLKTHYFFFLGAVSPVFPFLMVAARQLGIPVIFTGTIGGLVLMFSVILKPFIGSAADAFPKARKAIFISILALMVVSLASIDLLPKLYGESLHMSLYPSSNISWDRNFEKLNPLQFYSEETKLSECYVDEAWDCVVLCSNGTSCNSETVFSTLTYNNASSFEKGRVVYDVGKNNFESFDADAVLRLSCIGSLYSGNSCPSLWSFGVFWAFVLLFTLGQLAYAVANTISDAICIDSVGKDGDYGNERAWGTVGWGLMGPISGFLIDWSSGSNTEKDYTPAFAILIIFGTIDIIVSSVKLQVPRIKADSGVWSSVLPLLKKPQIIAFFIFAIFNGAFDGVVASYLFVVQEDMAKGTPYMKYMKFIQGLTLFVQCAIEAPFMWVYKWFDIKLGARKVTSLVLFLYIFRLFGLALVGLYGPVWATLITELLNGPCYGLGYTAVVVYAGQISPPGTSATVQCISNLCYESFGYAMAAFLGGILYTKIGGPGLYFTFGAMSVVIFLSHFLLSFLLEEEIYSEDESKGDRETSSKPEGEEMEEMLPIQPYEIKPVTA